MRISLLALVLLVLTASTMSVSLSKHGPAKNNRIKYLRPYNRKPDYRNGADVGTSRDGSQSRLDSLPSEINLWEGGLVAYKINEKFGILPFLDSSGSL